MSLSTPHAAPEDRERPVLTVAMVTYNARATLGRAIRSVLDQRNPETELVLVDGASEDGTVDVIRAFEPWPGRWTSEPDGGIYDAMNKARRMARGRWLLYLGADDELVVPVDRLLTRLTDDRAVYYGNVELRSSGAMSGGRFSAYRLMQRNICHQAILYPRSVYSCKAYDTGVGLLADHKYNLELWGSGTPFVHLDATISRFDDRGASAGGDPRFEPIKLETIRRHFGWPLYAIKRMRNAAVRMAKRPRRGTA